jgi:hypothetical protein
MLWLLNRYSYLITTALAMGIAWIVGARFGGPWPAVAVAGVGVGLALIQRTLRGGASDVAAWREIGAEPGPRQPLPLLLFLYSNT